MLHTYNYNGYDFIFDKSFALIGILDEGDVLKHELQESLEKRFTGLELLDFIDGTDRNLHYKNLYADWQEELTNFIP